MKKKILSVILTFCMAFMMIPAAAHAAETDPSDQDVSGMIDQVKQQLSAAFADMDEETAGQVFAFLKETVKEADLSSEEGISSAIKKGEKEFGVTISEKDARELVTTMEKLEGMGFSAEYVIDKTESLYNEYGADFVDHADEVVAGAVKNAASNAVGGFFSNLKNSIKDFFSNIFG